MADEQDNSDGVDRTLEDRLAKLGKARVDTSRLERNLDAAIPGGGSTGLRRIWGTRRFYALAASVLLVAGVGLFVVLMRPTGPRIITADELVAIHEHYRDHDREQSLTSVTTAADANVILARQWADAPQLPDIEGGMNAECCLYRLTDCRVACLHMKTAAGSDVTLVVGHVRDLRAPEGKDFVTSGQGFSVHQVGAFHVLSIEAGQRFIALVSDIPISDLQSIASAMKL
jgi:hypothetical protein